MPKTTCPFCYRAIKPREILYVCSGRAAPGMTPCVRAADDERIRETGSRSAMRPTFRPTEAYTESFTGRLRGVLSAGLANCPRCHASSGLRACPHCHTPLPGEFASSPSPLIAMVGAYGAGKSVYLAVLANTLKTRLAERFDAAIRLTGDSQGGEESGLKWLESNVRAMFDQHRLIGQTAESADGRKEPVVFEWRKRGRVGTSTSYLSFYDTAGEDLKGEDRAKDLKYLASADALVLLLDPLLLRAARDEAGLPPDGRREDGRLLVAVESVTEALREARGRIGKPVDIPVAATFAKIDAFFGHLGPDHPIRRVPPPGDFYDETAGAELHEHVRALLVGWGGGEIDSHLRHNYREFRYFPVSSLGEPPDGEAISDRGVRPLRVEEPLLWLLSRFGMVKARKPR
ncbi:zinc ribbon domain-containing protein [Phytomonospora endophytica]|uniref:Double-GTPase 2 domain-containing protein n=1 Tax=Phytomonospora endophytica TaxID=714109 RepID=A0A841FSY2_9ACTN|nr:zinc ribbon domain-containing protein [Phytomonospora endophytica]MBB6036858.1 hypothetical protein [Phytomonospora endophytica]GIG68108.1 hypothetical protein Pen01_44030 [Phytomonospora endophytica]